MNGVPETWRQPDRRSCGAAVLVAARRSLDPGYAARVADEQTFAAEVLALHRRLTSVMDRSGRRQVPWLRIVGTPPWAVARELRHLTGTPYAVRVARHGTLAWEHVRRASTDRPVAVYVGDRWLPRHVVLAVGPVEAQDPDPAIATYEPTSGRVLPVTRRRWVAGPLALAGWHRTWFVVAPLEDVPVRPARERRTRA